MKKPTLDRMYETFIKIGTFPMPYQDIFQTIKAKLYPTVMKLIDEDKINWYSFLIHDKGSGVPTTDDDVNGYLHIRFSLSNENVKDAFIEGLPDFCVMTRKVNLTSVQSISFEGGKYNPSLRKHDSIEEVWRIIGEQSELIITILDSYKDDVIIPPQEIGSHLHYFLNMVQMSVIKCPNCEKFFLI